MVCVPASSAPSTLPNPSQSTKSGANVGAIAGGVIAGVAAIALVTYLVWRFCIKTKRQQYEQENWAEEPEEQAPPSEKDFAMRRDQRASTHTVGSVASSVLTRASNIIQIAYIPGVTNRSAPSTPGLLVPPVPPIPIALSSTPSTPRFEQEHFFMPGDLRDSTYSGYSDRTSYARQSVASTIYGKNAVVSPVPATTVIRGKAAVVSVNKSNASTPGDLTPPVPSVDYGRYSDRPPPSPAFSVGSTFLNNASAATQVKPQVVRLVSNPKVNSVDTTPNKRDSFAITIIDDTPSIEQGPFSDRQAVKRTSNSTLGPVKEESEIKKASSGKTTPFGDEHEVR